MLNNVPIFIGLRYTRAKRRHQFISFISGFSLLGMALGTLALIVVLSVMNGFDSEIKQRILSVVPHGFIDQTPHLPQWQVLAKQANAHPEVIASAPYIAGFGMVNYQGSVHGVEIQGILPQSETKVSVIEQHMLQGGLADLKPGEFGIVLGNLLARYLRVNVGEKVIITLPQVTVTPAGVFPRSKRFTVVGVFEVGAQVDQQLAMIHLSDAQRLYRMPNAVQGIHLKVDDIYRADAVMADLAAQLGDGYDYKDWSQTQGSLFQAVQMEKRIISALLMIIIAVAALNIVTSLVLMVADKRSDIAVLRTLGMSAGAVMSVFIVQGSAVGIIGIAIGALIGCLLAWFIGDIVTWLEHTLGVYLFDPNVYFISHLPSELRFDDVVMICGCAIVMSIVATLYPAYRAAKVAPAEVLRYE